MQNIPFIEDLIQKFGVGNAVVNGNANASALPAIGTPAPTYNLPPIIPEDTTPVSAPVRPISTDMGTGLGTVPMPDTTDTEIPPGPARFGVATAPDFNRNSIPDIAPPTRRSYDYFGGQPSQPINPAIASARPINAPDRPSVGYFENLPPLVSTSGLQYGVKPVIPGADTTTTPATTTGKAAPLPELTDMQQLREAMDPRAFDKGTFEDDQGNRKRFSSQEAADKAGFHTQIQAPGSKVNKKWSIWEKIGSALAGWAQGGLLGGIAAGTDRNYFQQLKNQRQTGRLLPAIQTRQALEQQAAETALKRQEPGLRQQQIDAQVLGHKVTFADAVMKGRQAQQKWTPRVDPNTGLTFMQFDDASIPERPYVGADGRQVRTGVPITQGGRTVYVSPDRYSQETGQQERANVQAINTAAKDAADKQFEADKENLSRIDTYNKAVQTQLGELAKQGGISAGELQNLQAIGGRVQTIRDEINSRQGPIEGDNTAQVTEREYRSKLWTRLDAAQKEYDAALAKSTAAKSIADYLQNNNIPKPGTLTYNRYTPQLLGQKIARASDLPAFAKKNGMTVEQAKAWFANNGYTLQ